MRKIAILNQKGGVGKTTTVVNLAAALAQKGQRVMVVDLDPQAHLTIHLGADADGDADGIYEVLTGSTPISEALQEVRQNLWLLAASIDLVGAESELVNEVGREIILRQAVKSVEDDFDYLIIDCPPSLGLLTLNSLAAVNEVLIPIQPHFLALQGFSRLLQTVTLVQTRINPQLRVSAILMCLFDSRTSLSGEVRDDILAFLSGARNSDQPWADAKVIPVNIRRNIKLAEAPSHGQTIFEYEPTCNGAMDYLAVAEFLHSGQVTDTGQQTTQSTDIPAETQDETADNEANDDFSRGPSSQDDQTRGELIEERGNA
ncbi:MAG: ParA family protein [Planctomycetes bacterium]|nr:ParA family protein [Planctomycetota bacterium]